METLRKQFIQLESAVKPLLDSPLGLAMQFFYEAVFSNHRRKPELSMVQLMIAAEALVVLRDDKKRQTVSRRIGGLSLESYDEYELCFSEMKTIYDIRSGVVHGGGKKVKRRDLSLALQYLRKAILERIKLRNILKEILVMKLDEVSEDPPKLRPQLEELCLTQM